MLIWILNQDKKQKTFLRSLQVDEYVQFEGKNSGRCEKT